jgi:CDP-diacylglycerol--glycerol-3-phosphate 3-phosphatidyltransferase
MGESGAGRTGLTERGWSRLHHGLDPADVPFVRGWLRIVAALARPVHRVPPMVFTVAGAALAVMAVAVAARWPWPALALVAAAVLCDALDGAVAVLADRASALGAVADKAADRVADTAFALVIWRCGAPWWLAGLAAALSLGLEAVRTVRGGAALSRITVAERPSRVICTALACVSAGVSAAVWPATVCAAVWVALALVGLVQVTA